MAEQGRQHYFSADPGVASRPGQVRVELEDVQLDLRTDSGVFSHSRLDPGTKVLLENAPLPRNRGDILDLGCGYGPIALTFATRRKRLRVWAVDVNERALGLVRENAETARLGNVTACLPDEVPEDVRFGTIYSNPPIRIGKAEMHAMLLRWLPLLQDGGTAYLVVQKHLGSDSLAKWLDAQGLPAARLLSHRGYRLLEVQKSSDRSSQD
ncbi:class I SAM-dependent methyltransferase [Streptomyces clavuligerus]|uniref:16S rRNA methyltransferase n=1 Tax=Streptomyces clavuligerus TaxID=1901 RepID=B5GW92_STRCL|nr:methyltransferase [Streptomyces clavuligerus]ANW21809.1 MFS transporter [Streptomyces clavuligerus]AXU16439.1 methyltransferase domain-containing protein [Streptomyces clavuligerus]EDY50588.1 methyltransferase [Streptomyces clavuligerus]EFG09794.1 16S rRNA methyltransferase [Streptomyces clavuligerus]MBY6302104.1 methyltransferase [Streptomyces clavuligerus]